MAAKQTNEWKVGAFIVGGVVCVIAALFWLGFSRFDAEVIRRTTYFDESIQGLEIGAPVKVRGVTIGKVVDILLAPDHRLVEVQSEIRVDALRKANAVDERSEIGDNAGDAPPEMRVIIASQGITGIKFLEADFFAPDTPKLALSFDPPSNYIPSAPSTLKSLEDAVRGLGDELPLVIRDVRSLVVTLEDRVAGVDTERLSASITALADEVRALLDGSADAGIGADVHSLMDELRTLTASIDAAVLRVAGENGAIDRATASLEQVAGDVGEGIGTIEAVLVESDLPATTATLRDAANAAEQVAVGLEPATIDARATLRDLSRALRRIEGLAALLERDPGVLLRGRSAPTGR